MAFSQICGNCDTVNSWSSSYCVYCGQKLSSNLVQAAQSGISNGSPSLNNILHKRYLIIGKLGKGGMGTVYKAEDTLLGNRPVAIKEMSQQDLSPQQIVDATDAFKREALMLARLHHPHLPVIHDFFGEQDRWYLVMSFIEGETLEQYQRKTRQARLPLDEVITIGLQLCNVFAYLHAQQPPIIFRDLKPANIMRTPSGELYLIDFGIARHFKAGQAKDTESFGSKGYAAPEQYGHTQTSPQTDIYSLGAVLYQLLTGIHPYDNVKPFHFAPLNSYGYAYPLEMDVLLQHMLEIAPGKRPTDIAKVELALLAIRQSYTMDTLLAPIAPKQSGIPPTLIRPSYATGTVLLMFDKHLDKVTSLAWSPTSDRIASASIDKTVRVWDSNTGSSFFTYSGHTQGVTALEWSTNGKYIASGGFDRVVHIWDAMTAQKLQIYQGHNTLWSGGDAVRALAWSPDGTRIASVSGDSTVQVWDTATACLVLAYHGHGDQFPVRCIAWSPDGACIASAAHYCDVWDATTGQTLYSNRSGQTHALAWSPDSKYVAMSISHPLTSQEAVIQVCNIYDESIQRIYRGHTRPAYALAWSHHGTAIASADNEVHVWAVSTTHSMYIFKGHKGHITSLGWSVDDTRIASAGIDATVQVWQAPTQYMDETQLS